MSIIEEAVRKNAERNRQAIGTEPPRGQARLRRVPAAPVDTSHAERFQPIALDKAALHDSFVLPQLQDAGALRAYKILRTRVLRRLEANQWHSFAVTGVTVGEGKTLTAINLAIALAQDPSTWVALIDLDLQRPRVAEYLGMRSVRGEKGLSDYLQGNASFENIVYAPDIERLAVIPNFSPMVNSSELLTSTRMAELMNKMDRKLMDECLQAIADGNEKDAELIRQQLFTFEDLTRLTEASLVAVFDQIAADVVVRALNGVPKPMQEQILQAVPSRARRAIEADLFDGPPVKPREAMKAQRAIADIALEMVERGIIELNRDEADEDDV